MERFRVTFYPDNKTVEVEKDRTILSAALSAGVYIASHCGGDGVCGRCKVILKKGRVSAQSQGMLSEKERAEGVCLACLTAVEDNLEIEVPASSRLNLEAPGAEYSLPEDVETLQATAQDLFVHSPLATKIFLNIPEPKLEEKLSDTERLLQQVPFIEPPGHLHMGLSVLRGLSELLRASDWKVTVTLAKKHEGVAELINVEPGDTSQRNFGICFDIGTTTLSGQMVDLNSKKVLGTKATYNKQAAFGSDIITRIMYARNKNGLEELHRAVVDDMNEIIREFVRDQAIDLNDVTCVVCSGNTTMMHLLLRVDPTYIRKEPYTPVFNSVGMLRAAEAGILINPRGLLACVPGVASYVGGDITAGVLSSGQYEEEGLTVFIDIGTNGEIVLGNREFLVCAAASAGPAFEGSGVSCGMRAARGAIQKVVINSKDLSCWLGVIGNGRPSGICGSGYIDAIAEMLCAGVIDKNGKIREIDNPRIRQGELGKEFVLAFASQSAEGKDIVITEPDIENLKRAKAAIYSAISVLVRHLDLDFSRIDKVFIAGGFGTYLNTENAVRIGLLPDISREKFSFIGNSSLSGSRQVLLSWEAMRRADQIARKMNYVELSVEPGYMDEYMAALFFPHTDLGLFPTVRQQKI